MIGASTAQAGLSPPLGMLGGCPDPRWGVAGRALILVAPQDCLGPRWVCVAAPGSAPPGPAPIPPIPPPSVPEGSIPYLDDLATP
jgi:hypothetical protein